jgi:hypothetical protein
VLKIATCPASPSYGGNGHRLRVDPRDRPGLAAMALLRQIR